MFKKSILVSVTFLLALTACSKAEEGNKDVPVEKKAPPKELVVYSSRKEQLVQPLFDAYTAKTGTKIKFVTDKAEALIQKLKAEGANTQADLFMTVDAGNLVRAANAGLLQPTESELLEQVVPANLQDPRNQWFGLSKRARTLVYSPERIKEGELQSYESLGDEHMQGRLCLRTSKKVYNQSLVAMMMSKHGIGMTEKVVAGWVRNLATEPFSNDTKAMQAVIAGQCDVTVVNTYYLGRLLRDNPETPLKVFWPNQGESSEELEGVHVNISGAGVTKHAKHPNVAKAFLDWMVSDEAQTLLANGNLEYPVSKTVELDPIVAAWGYFKEDNQSIAEAGELQPDAVMLMDKVGYN